MNENIVITDQLIEAGKSKRGGWSKAQFAILGVAWPPLQGWKHKVRGRIISPSDADRFLSLRNSEDSVPMNVG